MVTKNASRTQQQTSDQNLIDGLKKHASTVSTLLIGGTPATATAAAATLQARIDAANAAVSTKATWQAAVKSYRDELAKTKTFVSALRQTLLASFGGSIDTLADFGLKPHKTAVKTPEQKALAAAKAKATRAARHTMGSKQKAKVKGVVADATAASPGTTSPSTTTTPPPAAATSPAAKPVDPPPAPTAAAATPAPAPRTA